MKEIGSRDTRGAQAAQAALVCARVLDLSSSPESGRRMSPDLIEAVRGLDIWVWGDLDQEVLEAWRRVPFEPLTARLALEDLLVYATLARDWDAVATLAVALAATRAGIPHEAWLRVARPALLADDAAVLSPESPRWSPADFLPSASPHEARALAACANAWDARARRLREAIHETQRGSPA